MTGSKLKAFNEKLLTLYGFGTVFLVMRIIMFVFGAQRTSSGSDINGCKERHTNRKIGV
jgi:hypothetical protein